VTAALAEPSTSTRHSFSDEELRLPGKPESFLEEIKMNNTSPIQDIVIESLDESSAVSYPSGTLVCAANYVMDQPSRTAGS
jgi:hypothetical protein